MLFAVCAVVVGADAGIFDFVYKANPIIVMEIPRTFCQVGTVSKNINPPRKTKQVFKYPRTLIVKGLVFPTERKKEKLTPKANKHDKKMKATDLLEYLNAISSWNGSNTGSVKHKRTAETGA